jgi:phosphoribosyl-ATP pyrophosphohydrolase/phosphoribosyl-AMP cyclohydrolase
VTHFDIESLDWSKTDGLLPTVVQDATTGEVLMLGFMNPDALEATRTGGEVVFFSRSRRRLWRKGETSGNVLTVVEMAVDCDGDTLLIQARPAGPTCHRGTTTCFHDRPRQAAGLLGALERTIDARLRETPEGSYVAGLVAEGRQRVAQKVGEEGVEFALAAAVDDTDAMIEEGADLLFHLLVGLRAAGLSVADVLACLDRRQGESAAG